MLSRLDHINIVGFVGYSMDPFLLIVMDFVSGGTLTDYVKNQDPADPPSVETVMKILIGSAAGLLYLHATEPLPIIHRDIKSENILLTEEFEPRIADLGEARVMAEDHAMTMVGTNGYTAPEILKGEHYGTPADVFSFAIVMCELLTLRAPYSDIRKGAGKEGDEKPLSWDQVVALTHKDDVMLRPTLPDDIDAEAAACVRMCWAHDPAARPSFTVIVARLEKLARGRERDGDVSFKERGAKTLRAFFRSFHDLLWLFQSSNWNEQHALSLVDASINVTSTDKTLCEILSAEKGLDCIKTLGWMMFGGFEDGAEIVPEPLLEADIVCDARTLSGLITFNFAVRPPAKRYQWRVADTKEFDALGLALDEMEKALQQSDEGEALEKAVVESKADAKPRRRRLKRKRKAQPGRKKNKEVKNFMKAAKYVQGMGAGKIHPSAKLKLFGLRMQALHGEASAQDGANAASNITNLRGLKGCLLALQELKVNAWRSEKGKGRKEAMLEYVEFLTSIAPNWSVAAILGGHESMKDKNPKRMVWVLRVQLEEVGDDEVEKNIMRSLSAKSNAAPLLLSSHFRATSIEILQSSGDSTARLLGEERVARKGETDGLATGKKEMIEEDEENVEKEVDPFVAAMPKDLTLEDCIIDKTKHKTIEEQRLFYAEKMREMARSDRDEEDGWTLYGETKTTSKLKESLKVYERSVEWSPSKQMRSVAETSLDLALVFRYIYDGIGREATAIKAEAYPDAKSHHMRKAFSKYHFVFLKKGKDCVTGLQYREIPFPWPLGTRDAFTVIDCALREEKGVGSANQWFCWYSHSFDPPFCLPRPGFVRMRARYQGFVGTPRACKDGTRLTWLLNVDTGLLLISTFSQAFFMNAMTYPLAKVRGAERKYGALKKSTVEEEGKGGVDDPFIANMPKNLTIQHCLIDKEKYPTIDAQRAYFRERMLAMARHGHDEEDGWTFLSKTQMKGLLAERQLDVYEREVKWSNVKQLRSVVETSEVTCDEVFDFLSADFGSTLDKDFKKGLSADQTASANAVGLYPFLSIGENNVTVVLCKDFPFPWPLTPRYFFIVQDYLRFFDDAGKSSFFTYNHDVEHPYFSSRDGFVRAKIRFQGLVGEPIMDTEAILNREAARLTWLVNIDFGGMVPTTFVREGLLNMMFYPRAKLNLMEQAFPGFDPSSRRRGAGSVATGSEQEQDQEGEDAFILNMPQNLSPRDCLVAEFKDGKTLDEQRSYFVEKLTEMAREGHDEEDGWKYKGKTNARGVEVEDQLDVYERKVEWSAVKQMRTVVQTSEFSCDEVFDFFRDQYITVSIGRLQRQTASAAERKAVAGGFEVYPFVLKSKDNVLGLFYKELPLPWPFEPRYFFIVQEYQRLQSKNGSSWFVCYNHDVEHEYFSNREGFQKMSIKFQGLVGVPRGPKNDSSGGGGGGAGATTRLTWLMNVDFRGLVPTASVQSALSTTAAYPQIKLLEMRKKTSDKREADLADTVAKLRGKLREKEGELQQCVKDAADQARKKDAELVKLRKEIAELRGHKV